MKLGAEQRSTEYGVWSSDLRICGLRITVLFEAAVCAWDHVDDDDDERLVTCTWLVGLEALSTEYRICTLEGTEVKGGFVEADCSRTCLCGVQ